MALIGLVWAFCKQPDRDAITAGNAVICCPGKKGRVMASQPARKSCHVLQSHVISSPTQGTRWRGGGCLDRQVFTQVCVYIQVCFAVEPTEADDND